MLKLSRILYSRALPLLVSKRPLLRLSSYTRLSMGNQESVKEDDPTFRVAETPKPELTFTEEELRVKLSEEEYRVTQQKGWSKIT